MKDITRRLFFKKSIATAGVILVPDWVLGGNAPKWTASHSPKHFPKLSGVISYEELFDATGGRLFYKDGNRISNKELSDANKGKLIYNKDRQLIIPVNHISDIVKARSNPKINTYRNALNIYNSVLQQAKAEKGRLTQNDYISALEQAAMAGGAAPIQSLSITENSRIDITHYFDTGSEILYDHVVLATSADPSVSINKDNNDAIHAPPQPGDYARMHTIVPGFQLGYDVKPFDEISEVRRTWSGENIIQDKFYVPMDGTSGVIIDDTSNPVDLGYWLIGIRKDESGVPQKRQDIRVQNSDSWPVIGGQGKHSEYDVDLLHPLVAADLIADGTIDFKDFAEYAQRYLGSAPDLSDINADGVTDIEDLAEIAHHWLQSYTPGL